MDDNNLRTVSESPQNAIDLLESAWQKSMLFDQLAGIKVNTNKTVCFGNTPQTRSLLVGTFSSLRLVNSFVLVGGVITVYGRADTAKRDASMRL